jgi:hypothetical protein
MHKKWFSGRTPNGPGAVSGNPGSDLDSSISEPPGPVDRLLITQSSLLTTLVGLASGRDREMLCYWIGTELSPDSSGRTRALVTTVAFPLVESYYDSFRVMEGQLGLITTWCAARDLWILAQAHTHPTDEPHSEADEHWPVSHRPGFISVVFPFFAQMSHVREPQWRAHELLGGGRWRTIDPAERFEIVSDVWLPGMK